jgi:hypothetical protein
MNRLCWFNGYALGEWANPNALLRPEPGDEAAMGPVGRDHALRVIGVHTDSDATIEAVRVRLYSEGPVRFGVYAADLSRNLAQGKADEGWGPWCKVSRPLAGWTWADVRSMELVVWAEGSARVRANQVEVECSGGRSGLSGMSGRVV